MASSKNFDHEAKLMVCIGFLLNNKSNSDVQFHFTKENALLYGHKLIMGLRSSVFKEMFHCCQNLQTEHRDIFVIEDTSPSAFLEMLKFIYTDEANIMSNNFAEIMEAARKYSVNHLEKMCCDFMKPKLDVENCCSYFQQCFIYDNELTKDCLDMITENIASIISRNLWKDFNEDQMLTILKKDNLDISELDLFEGVMKWAIHSCENEGIEATAQSVRHLFTVVFDMVRFPTMTLEEFCIFHRTNEYFLNTEEISDIFQYINAGTISISLRHSTIKRKRKSLPGSKSRKRIISTSGSNSE